MGAYLLRQRLLSGNLLFVCLCEGKSFAIASASPRLF